MHVTQKIFFYRIISDIQKNIKIPYCFDGELGWLEIIPRFSLHPLTKEIYFSHKTFLKSSKLSTTKKLLTATAWYICDNNAFI